MKPGLRFLRHDGIYRSDRVSKTIKSWGRSTASRWSVPGPAKGRDGRNTPCSSSAMSSGRLFLDRVARQQSPSPLHRQAHPKTVPGWGTMNLQRTANSVLTVHLGLRPAKLHENESELRTIERYRSGEVGQTVEKSRLFNCLIRSVRD
jgi:hypothetical protein